MTRRSVRQLFTRLYGVRHTRCENKRPKILILQMLPAVTYRKGFTNFDIMLDVMANKAFGASEHLFFDDSRI